VKVAVVIGLAALVAVVVGAVALVDNGGDNTASKAPLATVLAGAQAASEPFAGLTEVRVRVGSRCLRLAVADTLAERVAGLRDHTDLGGYDGLLFVFEATSDSAFTMSGVTVPLDIGFYERDGTRDSGKLMKPCAKAETDCPVYRADDPFLYAIETPGGQLPAGALGACSSA
jgi:uncharacterized membrane protein (UPF0127 family)